jgi:DNA-binding PadR family transcriptional regulator
VRNITHDVIDVEVHVSDEELGLGRFSDPALFVLVSLAGGEKHGYAMIEDIEETCGARPGPGTLYGAIARLERRRLVEPLATEDRRRPYRLTAAGASALERRLWELEGLARAGLGRLATT